MAAQVVETAAAECLDRGEQLGERRRSRAPGDPLTALDDGASEGHKKDCDGPAADRAVTWTAQLIVVAVHTNSGEIGTATHYFAAMSYS